MLRSRSSVVQQGDMSETTRLRGVSDERGQGLHISQPLSCGLISIWRAPNTLLYSWDEEVC